MPCSIEVQAALQSELAEMTLQLDLMKEEHERAVAEVRRPLHGPAGLTASSSPLCPHSSKTDMRWKRSTTLRDTKQRSGTYLM